MSKEEGKPDFWYIANTKFGDSPDNSSYVDGCDFAWENYALPVQKELSELKKENKEQNSKIERLKIEVDKRRENFKKANYARNEAQIETYKLRDELSKAKKLFNTLIPRLKAREMYGSINEIELFLKS